MGEGQLVQTEQVTGPTRCPKTLRVFDHDIPREVMQEFEWHSLAVDTETDGLLYRRDALRLLQFSDIDRNVVFVRNPRHTSKNLIHLLQNTDTLIFHHALFDIGFIYWWMGVKFDADDICCTKIASKILNPTESSSLGPVIERNLDRKLEAKNKEVTRSNWNVPELTKDQIDYAYGDVLDLHDLYFKLYELLNGDEYSAYTRGMKALRNKVYNEVEGYTDLLQYEHDKATVALREEWQKRLKEMSK